MRRGAKPAKAKVEARRPAARVRDLETRLAESLEQQAATAEILRVIGTSPMDTQPVFDGIARSGVTVCGAKACALFVVDGDMVRVAATHGVPEERVERFRTQYPMPLSAEDQVTQTLHERRIFHLADIEHNPAATPGDIENARLGRYRTRLMVPMLRGDRALGLIAVTTQSPAPFSDQQVALLRTFADQAVIAIENVRLFTELGASNRELTTALDTQTATSDILRVISQSQTDVQPVFDAIVASAVRLLGGYSGLLTRLAGDRIELGALTSTDAAGDAALRAVYPRSLHSEALYAQVTTDRVVLNIAEAQTDPQLSEAARALARARGYESMVAVPLLRHQEAVGSIGVTRRDPGGFSDDEIALLKTFADQAVIAIENVRLFTELREKNEALTLAHAQVSETLEQQTATAEILRVISSSPTDVQPVFDVIVERAVHLCGARFGRVYRFDGGVIHMVAGHGLSPVGLGELQRIFPRPASDDTIVGRAILSRQPAFVRDIKREEGVPALSRTMIQALGTRSQITIPMLRAGEPIGAMTLGWAEPEAFDEQQIALVKTFADQAVIAIENVRLFTELGSRNRDLTEALEQQTATAEILRVISRSQTDVQPVFDTIVRSAVKLCDGLFSALFQFDGELIHQVAHHNFTPEALEAQHRVYPARPSRGLGAARAILDRAVVHIPDVEVDPDFQHQAVSRAIGWRSGLFVPMLREGAPIGVIMVARAEAGPFSDSEIELLKTFADQAVIAVENARLFKELEARTGDLTRSVEQLTALGEVGRAVSSTLDLETVLTTIVSRAVELSRLDGGVVFEYEEATEEFVHRAATETGGALAEARRATRVKKGEGVVGRTAITLEPVQVPDITMPGAHESRLRENLIESGVRAILAVPMVREGRLIGSLVVSRNQPGDFPTEAIELLRTFATQSALAIQNARLFHEIADKSRQLEAASRHKSEFLANMSHELRTPLNAIIGFSEVLNERMFGELNDKQAEYLKDIHASGTHLLSLINDILDLSKVEAGRMELELTDFDLPAAVDNAVTLIRERASRKGVTVRIAVEEQVGMMQGDERKIRQVLLNLLSNAIKFTPEGGRIEVAAVLNDGSVEVSVSDTGVGIAPEDQEAVFEEFRQVGASAAKQEGTGLGLALARKFIELHGGKIWVTSQVGAGSTFTFTLPLQRPSGA